MASRPEKFSLEQLLRLVAQLPLEQQEQLRLKLNGMAENQSPLGEHHPFLDWHINIDSLAAQQRVPEFTSVERLKADFWPADEDPNEFVTALRQWRQESIGRT